MAILRSTRLRVGKSLVILAGLAALAGLGGCRRHQVIDTGTWSVPANAYKGAGVSLNTSAKIQVTFTPTGSGHYLGMVVSQAQMYQIPLSKMSDIQSFARVEGSGELTLETPILDAGTYGVVVVNVGDQPLDVGYKIEASK